jgi:hypothetical protein
MKLLLDANAPITPYDDADALLVAGSLGIIRTLPRPAERVVADYLRNIYHYIPRILNVHPDFCPPLEFWFPVLANWSWEAMRKMQGAVRETGFPSRPEDHVQFMTESEAAVWAAVQDPNLRIQVRRLHRA